MKPTITTQSSWPSRSLIVSAEYLPLKDPSFFPPRGGISNITLGEVPSSGGRRRAFRKSLSGRLVEVGGALAMECLFGFVGNGFVVVVADTSANQSIVVQKTTEDKITCLDSHKLLGCIGESGDRVQFSNFIQKNMNLYQFRNGIPLTTPAAASFTRCELATALRKAPYQVNMMMAGFDKRTGPSLFYLDYIATLQKLEKGALGFGAYFILSIMDKYYQKNMNVEQSLQLVDKCIWEIGTRMVASPPSYIIKIVNKDGARLLERRGRPVEEHGDPMR